MGTISQKIEYLNETKQRQKTLINALGGNITNDTPFREYEKELVGVLPKVTGEGTNISLSPTIEYDLEVDSYKGDITQNTLEGYNLANCNGMNTLTQNGITFTINKDSNGSVTSIKLNGTCANYNALCAGTAYTLKAGTYTMYGNGATNNIVLQILNDTATSQIDYVAKDDRTLTLSNDTNIILRLNVAVGATLNNVELKPMIATASGKSFEPYCGGIQAPNPNYEIPVQRVTGTQEVEVNNGNILEQTNLSLFNSNKYLSTTNYSTEGSIEVKPNTTYSFTFLSGNIGDLGLYEFSEDNTETTISVSSVTNGSYKVRKFTTLPTTTKFSFYVGGSATYNSVSDFVTQNGIMLLIGDYTSATINYRDIVEGQTYTLHLGDLELAKIGNYQDYIYYDNGKWYKYGAIIKIDLKNYTDLHRDNNWGNTTAFYFVDSTNRHGVSGFATVADLYCNRLISDTPAQIVGVASKVNKIGLGNNNCIYFSISGITTDSGYITYFSNNPTYLYFKLETPITTEITNETLLSDLEYIRTHAMSYSGTTNISSSGNLPVIISASAIKQLS